MFDVYTHNLVNLLTRVMGYGEFSDSCFPKGCVDCDGMRAGHDVLIAMG